MSCLTIINGDFHKTKNEIRRDTAYSLTTITKVITKLQDMEYITYKNKQVRHFDWALHFKINISKIVDDFFLTAEEKELTQARKGLK